MAIRRGHIAGLAAVIVLALAAVGGLVTMAASGQQPGAARRPVGADNPTQGPRPPAHGAFFGARVRAPPTRTAPTSRRLPTCSRTSDGGSPSCTSTTCGRTL